MKIKYFFWATVFFITLIQSCEKHADNIISGIDDEFPKLNIQEIKNWYINKPNEGNLRKVKTSEKSVLWDFYSSGKFGNGRPFIVTELAYPKNEFLRADAVDNPQNSFDDKENMDRGLVRKALFFKDVNGQFQKYVLYILPDKGLQDDLKKSRKKRLNGNSFSGYIIIRDWENEKFVSGWLLTNGKFKHEVTLTSEIKPDTSNKKGRVASGYCSYYQYGYQECVVIPCPNPQSGPSIPTSNARIALSPLITQCANCQWITTSTESYCEGDGSSTFTGQVGQNANGIGGTYNVIPNGTNLNQAMANLVNTHSSNLTLSEKQYILDIDEVDLANAVTRALGMWSGLSIEDLKALAPQFFENEHVNGQEEIILSNIDGPNYYRIHLWRYLLDAYDAQEFAGGNFNNQPINGQDPKLCAQCLGNAFKHAMFRILNAATFGRQVSINLGVAHETNPPQGGLQIDRDMDNHNNARGIAVFDQTLSQWQSCNFNCRGQMWPYWAQGINDFISSGQMKLIIIDPAHANDQNYDQLVTSNKTGNSRR